MLGHSKGAVDAAAALSLFPELDETVAALVSLQGPHGGSAIAHDLVHTNIQKSITLGAIEKLQIVFDHREQQLQLRANAVLV